MEKIILPNEKLNLPEIGDSEIGTFTTFKYSLNNDSNSFVPTVNLSFTYVALLSFQEKKSSPGSTIN